MVPNTDLRLDTASRGTFESETMSLQPSTATDMLAQHTCLKALAWLPVLGTVTRMLHPTMVSADRWVAGMQHKWVQPDTTQGREGLELF